MDPRSQTGIDNDHKREAILERYQQGMLDTYDLLDWLLVKISEDTLDEVYEEYCGNDEDVEDPTGNIWEDGESGMPDHFKLANPVSSLG